jgi:hypothetical protein
MHARGGGGCGGGSSGGARPAHTHHSTYVRIRRMPVHAPAAVLVLSGDMEHGSATLSEAWSSVREYSPGPLSEAWATTLAA